MDIQFREFDPFNVWIWLELDTVPGRMEQQYIEEVFDSWFFLGKLGGFNAENAQVQEVGLDLSYMEYDSEVLDQSMMALMHNMGEVEFEGTRARCWFDLGTSDAIALDVLINAFAQLSREFLEIRRISIGGEDEDWPIDESKRQSSSDFN
ncbi:DUF3531 family protein [Limnothrix sp. FACHB-881]|uniref:DUF3531 family protein n=1 Tax=unclassified Limnothrix TaxID=2632864 RepID=UPI00081E36EA|nr:MULTISPECIES: DUF3531 family protein [unclassified Limnothrix]OCQ90339.1 hypothetical protein BCR12_15900 [Limnothrix sp. P13C2]MBD2161059.1 DUF3531 family protein [Limnothrix sp. FACHB-1083]MBD2191760.1 DUF3531 family protein [Limnothrix sp. FACHB-1088]MBD2636127.1 DUF3531 family protein [Limnothrix sp. FACHB-881]PIB04613.1 hypothetical protein AMR42_17090 [Limnothrix sp. PR1529]